ncbi:hypothetical protein D3C71_2189610 [compost metagenome]
MQCFPNQLIGHMRAVEITGINMIHPSRHRFAQHCQRSRFVFWRTKYTGTSKLHRAIAESVNRASP